jgi:hypothetical protein
MGRKAGEPATAKQRAAGRANLEKGRQARKERMAANADHPSASERWAALLSGQLSVKDLDDEEIERRQPRGKGGTFSGRHRAIPSHIYAAFEAEEQRRWNRDLRRLVPKAIDALEEILLDEEAKDRGANVRWTIERILGKTPDVVRLEGLNEFDRLAEAVVVDRDVAAGAESYLAEQAAEGNGRNSQ